MNIDKFKITYKGYLKMLTLLHLGLMVGQLFFIGIIFVLVNEEKSSIDINTQNILLIGIPVFILLSIFTGRFIYQQQLKKIRLKTDLRQKLISYRTFCIIQFALIESGALMCIIASFLTQNLVFVYGNIGVLLYFLSLRPVKSKIENVLNLDFKDLALLASPDFFVEEVNRASED